MYYKVLVYVNRKSLSWNNQSGQSWGNYRLAIAEHALAKKQCYDQVLWLSTLARRRILSYLEKE